jgi:hypothetical protein|tara:strand:+ start:52 stop:762 length:711 start_codon:yes stop_codon:yes gene_type:complete
MFKGILQLFAKEALKDPFGVKKRLPALMELITGTTGYHTKRKIDPTEFVEMPKWVWDSASSKMVKKGTQKVYPNKKWSYMMHEPKRKTTKELWRGETIHPDEQYISKAGIEHAEPGSWYSPNVLESMNYAVRPWKGGMGNEITNPGILRNIKSSDIHKVDPNFNVERGKILDHINLPPNLQELSHISLIPTLIARLRGAGLKEAHILSTIKEILKKKKPSGAADWKFYKRGGIASL